MTSVELKKGMYWVGAIDWNIRDFHGYSVHNGTTYNSYLLIDDKITLFDTVKHGFWNELLTNIKELVDPEKIDYLVINHVEKDHSGSLPEALKHLKPEKVFCSIMGEKIINANFPGLKAPLYAVQNGEELNVGKRNIKFLETRMLHWPDSMVSYLKEDRILVSNDIFGQHWATSERFDDQVSFDRLMHEAAKYYGNIVLPYSKLVIKLIDFLVTEKLKFDYLATDHGVIWRTHIDKIINAYSTWANQVPVRKAVIVYDSMWGSTEMMAKAVESGLISEGITVRVLNLHKSHRSDVMTETLDAKAVIFGSPTLNNGYLPTLADTISYMTGLRPEGKIGAAFGSYGWGGESVKLLNDQMEAMKFDVIDPGVKCKFVPDKDQLKLCFDLGVKVAKSIKEQVPA